MSKLIFIHTADDNIHLEYVDWEFTPGVPESDKFVYPYTEFLMDEPSYPGLPINNTMRLWQDLGQGGHGYTSDGNRIYDSQINCSNYVLNLDTYRTLYNNRYGGELPEIYACINVDKEVVQHENDFIHVETTLSATPTWPGTALPVTKKWAISLEHRFFREKGLTFVDVILGDFIAGVTAVDYTYNESMGPLGKWYLYEDTFDTVTVGPTTYRIRLKPFLNGVAKDEDTEGILTFVVYRNLPPQT